MYLTLLNLPILTQVPSGILTSLFLVHDFSSFNSWRISIISCSNGAGWTLTWGILYKSATKILNCTWKLKIYVHTLNAISFMSCWLNHDAIPTFNRVIWMLAWIILQFTAACCSVNLSCWECVLSDLKYSNWARTTFIMVFDILPVSLTWLTDRLLAG